MKRTVIIYKWYDYLFREPQIIYRIRTKDISSSFSDKKTSQLHFCDPAVRKYKQIKHTIYKNNTNTRISELGYPSGEQVKTDPHLTQKSIPDGLKTSI